ncbi:hypothetical protein ABZ442_30595 [Streptomyces triculaminicus]|uniref:hypothetical protein n=1 Tax=Streptomyces triculaminicus TaxID=2816232 RepID=UPI0033F112A0
MHDTIPLKHPLDGTGLSRQQAPAVPTRSAPAPAAAGMSRYHYPAFQKAEPGRSEGWVTYHFTGFSGREPEPEMPLAVWTDKTLTQEQRSALSDEYEAARILWSKARLRLQATPVLRQAVLPWQAWEAAQANLRRVFEGFWETEDGRWRAQLLRLTDAERAAKKAAEAWDAIAEQLARLSADQVRAAGYDEELELTTVAKEIDLDTSKCSKWLIDQVSEYEPTRYSQRDTPLVRELIREIDAQRERLREVLHFAGDRELATNL